MGWNKKKLLSLKQIDDLDDEIYYYIKYLDKQIDEYKNKWSKSKDTIRKMQDYINSNEEIVHFHSLKKGFNNLVEEYFKKVK